MNRFRQLRVFDRFLARVCRHFGERVILKGGLVLELNAAAYSVSAKFTTDRVIIK